MRNLSPAIAIVLLGTGASAHHSHPDFAADRRVTIEGTIEFLQYVNPHSQMTLRTADGMLYTIELPAARQLRLPGTNCAEPIYSDTLKIGDHVAVTAIPPIDPLRHELVNMRQ